MYLTSNVFVHLQQLAALLITKQVVGNVKEALVPFVKQKVKEWKLKKQIAKEKKEKDEKAQGPKPQAKDGKPSELDTPLMHQAEIEANMPEYEVGTMATGLKNNDDNTKTLSRIHIFYNVTCTKEKS